MTRLPAFRRCGATSLLVLAMLVGATSAHGWDFNLASSGGMPPQYTEDSVPVEGQKVTATWPEAVGTPRYQWQRCAATFTEAEPCAGGVYEDVDGATGQSQTLDSRSTNRLIRVVGTDDEGTYTAGAIGPVGGGGTHDPGTHEPEPEPDVAPQNQTRPSVSRSGEGVYKVGEKLSYTAGTWSGSSPLTVTKTWMRCSSYWTLSYGANPKCTAIEGATGNDYRLTEADLDQWILVRERAANSAGAASADSAQHGPVDGPPRWDGHPVINGNAVTGQTLTVQRMAWQRAKEVRVEWERCGAQLVNGKRCTVVGTGDTYALTDADLHHQIYVTEYGKTYTEAGVTSPAAGPVTAPPVKVKIEKPVIGDESWDAQAKIRKLLGDGDKTRVSFIEKRVYVADKALPNGGKGIEPLDVINVDPSTVTLPAPRVEVELKIWMGAHEGDNRLCPKIRAQLKHSDLDSAIDTLKKAKCSWDDLEFERSKKVEQPTVTKVENGKRPDIRVRMPASPADTDLRLFIGGAKGMFTVISPGTDWKLSAGHDNILSVFVVDRAGRLVKGAKVTAEGASVGVNKTVATDDKGRAQLVVKPTGNGTIDLFAEVADSRGDKIYGYGQIKSVERGGKFTTITGENWRGKSSCNKGRCTPGVIRVKSSGARAASLDFIWNALNALQSAFNQQAASAFGGAKSHAAGIAALAQQGTTPLLGLMGQVAGATQTVISQTFATSGVWLIGQAGGNVISTGGGNVISTGGGNVISTGGGNLISDKGLGVISTGGGNVISTGGGNVISTGGGNLVALPNNGGYVISTGGGNVIATGGGNVISTGGGNVISTGGGNVISTGGGN